MMPRTSHHDFNVQLQIHEGKGFPQILHGINQDIDQRSISLKPGHEYVIELYPYGQMLTEDVQSMSIDKRKCRMNHESFKGASHPIYTKDNCLYDCRIQKAFENCHCLPWDFVNKINGSKECDIFGRTCFFNKMENLTHMVDESCSHCIEECEWIKYRRKVLSSKSLELAFNWDTTDEYCNDYMCLNQSSK